jgi:hypothetical protein
MLDVGGGSCQMFREGDTVTIHYQGSIAWRDVVQYETLSTDMKRLLDSPKMILDFEGLWSNSSLLEKYPNGVGVYMKGTTIPLT